MLLVIGYTRESGTGFLFRWVRGGSAAALSIDEFAVALHRDATVAIDATLGWHLWATDLCLQAEQQHGRAVAQILQVPLFHNSTNDYRLPPAFESWVTMVDDALKAEPAK